MKKVIQITIITLAILAVIIIIYLLKSFASVYFLTDYSKKPTFTNIVGSSGIKNHNSVGISFTDYDSDGYQDIFLAGGSGGSHLYKNIKGSYFINVTPYIFKQSIHAVDGVFADYNNDGCQDLILTFRFEQSRLYKGNCGGGFEDVTKFSGINTGSIGYSAGAAWADYNNDGFLDVYIAAVEFTDNTKTKVLSQNFLYKNNGDGTFTDVIKKVRASGITLYCKKPKFSYALKDQLQPVWFDYNNDNLQDLFVASHMGAVSPLYKNNGDGTFTDVTKAAGLCRRGSNMGIAVSDYNNDGNMDLYTTNTGENYFWKNTGNGKFKLVSSYTKTKNSESIGWGTGFLDYDNDGLQDLYVTNGSFIKAIFPGSSNTIGISRADKLYKGTHSGIFQDVSKNEGIVGDQMKLSSAFADIDNNGFTDIISVPAQLEDIPVRFYKNSGNKNNWISIKLIGTTSNRDSIGSRVKVVTSDKSQISEVMAGSSYLAQNSLVQTFGVGKDKTIDKVEITWPSGKKKILSNIPTNQFIVIKEPR